ncbi:MAG: hypothetical protein ACI9N9_000018 [Enterobacterales bacterium]|jgi:hypothetical protein
MRRDKRPIGKTTITELIEPDYEGLAKVLNEFVELYKVCENKKLLDECLKNFCFPRMIINNANK